MEIIDKSQITEIKNFLTKEECDYLIDMIDANNVRSSVVVGGTNTSEISNVRTSSTSNLDPINKTVNSIHKKIANELGLDIKMGESLQGQKYEVGQYFKEHADYFSGVAYDKHCLSSGNRTFTFMIYLNDDFDGGGTNFPRLNTIIKPEKGKAIIWENTKNGIVQEQTHHEGMEVEKGTKYIVTSWWRENIWNGAEDFNLYNKKQKVYTHKDQIPKFTEKGFKVIKCPDETWNLIKESYEILKDKKQQESFIGKENVIIGGDSEILSFEHLPNIKTIIHKQLQPIHEEFCGVPIEPSFIYGIRSYKRNATLIKHVDRVETHHISSIIIVDKDLRCGCQNKEFGSDWALDFQTHDGEWHKIYAEVGDMIIYESAICEHGRTEPFEGVYFNNLFVHYKFK